MSLLFLEFIILLDLALQMFSRSNVYHAEMNTSTNYNQNRVTPSYSNGYNNNTSGNQSNLSNASIVGSYRVSHVD